MPISEQAFEALKVRLGTAETQIAVMESQYEEIDRRLGRIEVVLSRLTWIMVTGIFGAFVAFVVNGGLGHAVAVGGGG